MGNRFWVLSLPSAKAWVWLGHYSVVVMVKFGWRNQGYTIDWGPEGQENWDISIDALLCLRVGLGSLSYYSSGIASGGINWHIWYTVDT